MGLFGLNDSLLTDINTIQELPDILLSYETASSNFRTASAHSLNRVPLDDDLILHAIVSDNLTSGLHWYMPHPLLSQKVSNLNPIRLARDIRIDGEVRIHESHLVAETLCDTGNHVVNM